MFGWKAGTFSNFSGDNEAGTVKSIDVL
jgi:hypothetical protein